MIVYRKTCLNGDIVIIAPVRNPAMIFSVSLGSQLMFTSHRLAQLEHRSHHHTYVHCCWSESQPFNPYQLIRVFCCFQSPPKFLRYYQGLPSYVRRYVCSFVFIFLFFYTPFKLQLSNLDTLFLIRLSIKQVFQILGVILPFFLYFLRFLCKFEEQFCKNLRRQE